MKNLIPILLVLFSFLPLTANSQTHCCCEGCGNTCTVNDSGTCPATCFFLCSAPTPFTDHTEANCTGSACDALPIELAAFDLKTSDETVILSWITESETNNKGFDIQRFSGLNMVWKTIAFVSGAGSSHASEEYNYEDAAAPPGVNYYRLKQVDYDQTVSFSSVITAKLEEENKYTMYPTLARYEVLIKMNGKHDHNRSRQYQVFDLMGQLMHEGPFAEGVTLDVSAYSAGSYFVNISFGGILEETFKFSKVE